MNFYAAMDQFKLEKELNFWPIFNKTSLAQLKYINVRNIATEELMQHLRENYLGRQALNNTVSLTRDTIRPSAAT